MPRNPAPPATHAKHPQIDRAFRDMIVDGRLKPGDRLPTWDELETQFGVSRGTVYQAIRRLKDDGFLIARGSSGTFVADVLPHQSHFGLVFHHHPDMRHLWSRFQALLQRAAEQCDLGQQGRMHIYHGVVNAPGNEPMAQLVDDIHQHRLAGLILVHMGLDMRGTPLLKAKGIERVAISFAADVPGVPSVYPDRAGFIDRSLDYLQSRGRKRIALITAAKGGPDTDEIQRWHDGIEQRGMTTARKWIQTSPLHPCEWARNLGELLADGSPRTRPDGIVVADDHLIAHVAQGVRDATGGATRQLDLLSWGNFPDTPATDYPVTWVGVDTQVLLQSCLDVLDRQQHGKRVPRMTVLPVELRGGDAR